ncbi:hypothetical protein MQM_02723, partial [Staphylococcus aureus subsp. aureus VRS7]
MSRVLSQDVFTQKVIEEATKVKTEI